jgi:F-type H+-transporting ATPase subunit b
MTHHFPLKRLFVLLGVVALLVFASAALAQEATPAAGAGEGATTAAAEATPAAAEAPATSPLVPLGINTGYLIAQMVNFLIIALLLGAIIWRPLVNMLDSRSAKIEKGLEDAAAAANARRNAEAEAEKIQAQARADVNRAIEEARSRGEEVGRQVEAEARAEADRIRTEAQQRANEERDRQLADLRGQVAAISIAVAQRLIGESLDANRQQALISDFFSKVPAEAKSLSGDVEVVSAMPLTDAEKSTVQSQLGSANVTYSVDPSILGGVVVRSGERVIDGSVRSGLNDIAGRLR